MAVFETKSAVEGLVWPGLPQGRGLAILALLQQLEQSQWWPEETIRARQFRQLQPLLRHAATTIPFYRRRFKDLKLDTSGQISPED